jgi:hypothetical protein
MFKICLIAMLAASSLACYCYGNLAGGGVLAGLSALAFFLAGPDDESELTNDDIQRDVRRNGVR